MPLSPSELSIAKSGSFQMLSAVLRAPLQFFETTPQGRYVLYLSSLAVRG